jgi:hypothetical protein
LSELERALVHNDCLTTRVSEDTCAVAMPAVDERHAETELRFFLRVWQTKHPRIVMNVVV